MILPLSQAPHVRREVQLLLYVHFGRTELPPLHKIFVKVASEGYVLIGTYTIEDHDLRESGFPGPWLSDLIVKEQFRGLGYGNDLIKHAKRTTGRPLYLWSANPQVFKLFYSEGFKFVTSSNAEGILTDIAIFIYE